MLYVKIIVVFFSEIHTQRINIECRQYVDLLGALKKMRKATIIFISVCLSARYSAPTTQIFIKLIFEYYSKIRRENSRFIKIVQE
jgi:hypothetical protein